MVKGLIDTSIIIDLVRGFPDAQTWLEHRDDVLGTTHYVWLEVIQGAQNKQKQKAAVAILSDFTLVETTSEDVSWAVKNLLITRLAHHVDAFDSLIAATAHRLQVPLYTRNLKHFSPLLNTLAQRPF